MEIIESGWRFRSPIYLDAVVWNYENAPGLESPCYPEDVDVGTLQAAILAWANERHGTAFREFEELLVP